MHTSQKCHDDQSKIFDNVQVIAHVLFIINATRYTFWNDGGGYRLSALMDSFHSAVVIDRVPSKLERRCIFAEKLFGEEPIQVGLPAPTVKL